MTNGNFYHFKKVAKLFYIGVCYKKWRQTEEGMSEFKELIKSFSKSREFVRDFFVYGFKTRDEFEGWSSRTYDNERRRLESWLSGYVRQDYTEKGKNIYLSIDSNLLETNPLYRVWKAKSFTDNDIMLHFYIIDYLLKEREQTAERITDGLLDKYGVLIDAQAVRRKCNEYAKEGILRKTKDGREVLYSLNASPRGLFDEYPALFAAIKLYQLVSPLGIIGNTVMENLGFRNDVFRVKHSFFVHTLEDEILLGILNAMHEERAVIVTLKSSGNENFREQGGVPLGIFTSTRTGRRYVCLYIEEKKRFVCFRLDAVKAVLAGEKCLEYKELREKLEKNKNKAWGVSFHNDNNTHTEHVKLTVHINEETEEHIINRFKREGKGGVLSRVAPDTFTYETEVFDANEMLPWIRSFTGRIIKVESDCEKLERLFKRDFYETYKMYFN